MWQPIATAPKDNPNRQVLLWDPKVGLGTGAVFVGTFVRDWWRAYPAWTQVEPTHWMPVPLPPDAENDEREFREREMEQLAHDGQL